MTDDYPLGVAVETRDRVLMQSAKQKFRTAAVGSKKLLFESIRSATHGTADMLNCQDRELSSERSRFKTNRAGEFDS